MSMTEFFEADIFELDLVMSHMEEVERDASERMRNLMWAVLAPNQKRQIKPEDVVKFSWESDSSGDVTTMDKFNELVQQHNLKTL